MDVVIFNRLEYAIIVGHNVIESIDHLKSYSHNNQTISLHFKFYCTYIAW